MKHFMCIEITSKDDTEDFRAAIHCVDEYNNKWILNASGSTAEKVAKNAWSIYQDYNNWEVYGWIECKNLR